MIVDSSALVAIIFDEPERAAFLRALEGAPIARIAAPTVVEIGVVLRGKQPDKGAQDLDILLRGLRIQVEPFTQAHALLAWEAYETFGKGRHKARLNFGDTFSYALSKATGEPLLFKGADFSQTDITRAV